MKCSLLQILRIITVLYVKRGMEFLQRNVKLVKSNDGHYMKGKNNKVGH
jgi:hypothetical protein